MMKALLVSSSTDMFLNLDPVLAENNVETVWTKSGSDALSIIINKSFDLIITDESLCDMTGIDFTKKCIAKNPVLNLAVVSSLSHEEFHEASEGLGILMHLQPSPEKKDIEKLLAHLNKILSLTIKT